MPRGRREKSSTGIYHVLLRGINGQAIFHDNEDYEKLIQTLKKYKDVSKYKIYAYCLMSNHIHLLIKEGEEDLGIIFRRIGASYVHWYNQKYSRIGHLFQDRYKSEVVENDKYFLTVLRYIHQNPIKAGIENNIGKYPWSSYNEYLGENGICDTELALGFFSEDKKRAIELFQEFNKKENNDKCLEYEKPNRIHDKKAVEIIVEVARVEDIKQIHNFETNRRNKIIKELRGRGLSIRQIERLTGISFSIIRKI